MARAKIYKMFLFGIDNAGKTTVLNYLEGKKEAATRPTLAFNIRVIFVKEKEVQIWDSPGQKNLRKIWNNGFNRAKLLVFILDTSDFNRFNEAHEVFSRIMDEEDTQGLPVIFCFHKMDLKDAKNHIEEAREIFNLEDLRTGSGRRVEIIETTIFDEKTILKLRDSIIEQLEIKIEKIEKT